MINVQAIYMDLFRALGRDHPDKVIVARTVVRDNKTYTWHYWVSPDEIKSGDRVIANHHNLPDDHPQKYKRFDFVSDAYNLLGDYDDSEDTPFGKWQKLLTTEREIALGEYTGDSDPMNAYLREDTIYQDNTREELEGQREKIEKAINDFEIPDPLTVHRVVGLDVLEKLKQAHREGGIFKDAAFCSTTAISGSFNPDPKQIHMVIHVPAGKGIGVWLAPISAYPDENELLLNHGMLFEIHSITPATKDRGPRVELTIVGRDPTHP